MLLCQRRLLDQQAPGSPRDGIVDKARMQVLAHLHGVATPGVLASWPDVDLIDLTGLPDQFVLKSAGGATSRAVWPLARRTDDRFSVITTDELVTTAQLQERLRDQVAQNGRRRLYDHVRPPYFVETLLHGMDGSPIPDDVKFYMFFGQVGHVLLRRADKHGRTSTARYRYLSADGEDLGALTTDRVVDPAIPVPDSLPQMLEAARRLSLATRLPFVRVDLYETPEGPVFGEFTPAPGGSQVYTAEHDRFLGQLWEDAQTRLDIEVAAGMPFRHDDEPEQPTT